MSTDKTARIAELEAEIRRLEIEKMMIQLGDSLNKKTKTSWEQLTFKKQHDTNTVFLHADCEDQFGRRIEINLHLDFEESELLEKSLHQIFNHFV